MPDNVKTALSISVRRLLRPLAKIMLREGLTYSHFVDIAQMVFLESATKDFAEKGMKSGIESVCALAGIPLEQIDSVLLEQERYEASEVLELSNPFARVLHGWHNDRDYVGPYGFPMDLPFVDGPLNFTLLASRHAPGVSPLVILKELQRIGAVTEVGSNVWKPLKQEYIQPTLSPETLSRMASLVASLLSTLETNTSETRDGTELFERTMKVDVPLTKKQLAALHAHLKVVGGQFLNRIDTFAAIDLHEKMAVGPDEIANISAGLQCFLFVEPVADETRLRDAIDFNQPEH
jgi:hypothetical protein